ncbi:MAG: GlxA family transcriptional regulator [Pseudomonadota bacterium]
MTHARTRPAVAVILFDQVNAIDVAGPLEAFANAKTDKGDAAYSIVSWTFDTPRVRTESGLNLLADAPVPEYPEADILLVPGGEGVRNERTLKKLAAWLNEHHKAFDRIASVCTGAYALAEAGLLDGRKVTTHWAHAHDLQTRYPKVRVQSDALFLRDGRFFSSGGVTAGIYLALDLIEDDHGGDVAMKVARELVVFLRRTGAQAQFSMPLQLQTKASNRLDEVCKWAANNLDGDLSIDALATRAGLSARQFSRRFRDTFGTPPATYIKRLRLDAGRTLIGQGVSLSRAAHASGFGSTDGFRRAFEGLFGVSPSEYRKRFQQGATSQ